MFLGRRWTGIFLSSFIDWMCQRCQLFCTPPPSDSQFSLQLSDLQSQLLDLFLKGLLPLNIARDFLPEVSLLCSLQE